MPQTNFDTTLRLAKALLAKLEEDLLSLDYLSLIRDAPGVETVKADLQADLSHLTETLNRLAKEA